jgi:hypothetical protein
LRSSSMSVCQRLLFVRRDQLFGRVFVKEACFEAAVELQRWPRLFLLHSVYTGN